jgi:hypothetical protein
MDPSSMISQRKSTNGIRLRMYFSEIRQLKPVVSTTFSGPGRKILERNLLLTETAATAKVNQTQCI